VPPQYLDPIQDALLDLSRNYALSVVIATATQPAFPRLQPCVEMMADPPALFAALRRAVVAMPPHPPPPWTWEQLAAKLMAHDSALCIVNRRAHARSLIARLPPDTFHLSAQMCGAHRADVIAAIRARLRAGTPVRVVSTQLIEAGVDLDFPVVYRALAGLDAIAQAAGRCNREGRLERHGQVIVFAPPEESPHGILNKAETTTREMLHGEHVDPLDPAIYAEYFRRFFRSINNTGQDIADYLRVDPEVLGIPFRTVERSFRIVDDAGQCAVIVPYGDSAKWLRELRLIGPTRDNLRRLQRFTVNLPRFAAERLRAAGALEIVHDDFLAVTADKCYDARIGVIVPDADGAPEPSDLMV
jgi:CRISPR-associated endonuclease/helicase Cas3